MFIIEISGIFSSHTHQSTSITAAVSFVIKGQIYNIEAENQLLKAFQTDEINEWNQ